MKDVQCYELFRGIALKKSCIFIFSFSTVKLHGDELIEYGGRFQSLDLNDLLIVSVQKSDSGSYKCYAVNIKGEDSARSSLTVISKSCLPFLILLMSIMWFTSDVAYKLKLLTMF